MFNLDKFYLLNKLNQKRSNLILIIFKTKIKNYNKNPKF
jgi:hypothetical protein